MPLISIFCANHEFLRWTTHLHHILHLFPQIGNGNEYVVERGYGSEYMAESTIHKRHFTFSKNMNEAPLHEKKWSTLWLYNTWTECTVNSARQILVSGQVASFHILPVLQKSCGDSRGFTSKTLRKFCANIGKILFTSEKSVIWNIFVKKSDGFYRNIWRFRLSYKTG